MSAYENEMSRGDTELSAEEYEPTAEERCIFNRFRVDNNDDDELEDF